MDKWIKNLLSYLYSLFFLSFFLDRMYSKGVCCITDLLSIFILTFILQIDDYQEDKELLPSPEYGRAAQVT